MRTVQWDEAKGDKHLGLGGCCVSSFFPPSALLIKPKLPVNAFLIPGCLPAFT
jgi:hypothetical protein